MQPFKQMTIATTETSHTNRLMEEIASGCIHHERTTQVGHDVDTLEPKCKHKTNATQVEGTERMPQSNAAEQKPQGKAAEHSCRANDAMLTKLRARDTTNMN